MDFTKVEVAALEKAVQEVDAQDIVQLQDLQLAMIGGGIGEVIVG